jgi:hypothetical protein
MLDIFKKNGPPGPPDPQLLEAVKAYIDAHFEPEPEAAVGASLCPEATPMAFSHLSAAEEDRDAYPVQYQKISFPKHGAAKNASYAMPQDLGDYLNQIDAGFSETLLKLIDASGEKDSVIYKRANVDRRLFSKIRSNPDYRPSKATAVAFAIALELNVEETNDLIGRAGYVLSRSSKADLVAKYFIEQKDYNIGHLNEVLYASDLPLLGGTA